MLTYAVAADLAAWTGQPAPADANQKLRSASLAVRRATRRAIYDTDADGRPTNPQILQAFQDATCCLAAAYSALGLDLAGGVAGTGRVAMSRTAGATSVTYAVNAPAEQARNALLAGSLNPEAWAILQDAGALGGSSVGSGPYPRGVLARPPWAVE